MTSGPEAPSSIGDLHARLRDGELTEIEVIEAALDRAHGAQRELAAFASIDSERATRRAARLWESRTSGTDTGPLHAVPVVLKDNVAQAGLPNPAASRVLAASVAETDAAVVARLEGAGAVIVGRANMHELAWGGTTDNPHVGTCRNPWDRTRVPAGSSGGTAAAVAAGVAPLGVGTDTGGSIRLPSSVTNLTGLRPTLGGIPTDGVVPLAWTLDTIGPMAQDAVVAEAMYRVMAAPRPTAEPGASSPAGDALAGCRIAVPDIAFADLQPGVETALRNSLQTLVEAGAQLVDIVLGDTREMVDALVVLNAAEASAVHARTIRERAEEIGPDVRDLLHAGARLTAVEYLQAQRFRTHLGQRLAQVWERADVVLTPTLPFTAPRVGERTVRLGGREEDNLVANMRFTALASLTGTPALSLPIGFDAAGLPVGGQVVGPAGADARLLAIGQAWQRVTDHHLRRPPAGSRAS